MKLLSKIAALALFSFPALAQIAPQSPNSTVTVSTPAQTITGVYLGEFTENGVQVWIMRTGTSLTSIPKDQITKVDAASVERLSEVTEIRFQGSNTVGAKLAPDLARVFAAKQGYASSVTKEKSAEEFEFEYSKAESDKKLAFRFEAKGSGTAVPGLVGGQADIGMSSRPVNDKEVDAAKQANLGDLRAPNIENVIALDGVVVLVNPSNPVKGLNVDQISRIYAGLVKDWAEVGGSPGAIKLYARDKKSGTFDTFKALVLDSSKRTIAPDVKLFESSEDLSDAVSADPSSIGFTGFAYIRSAKALVVSTSCGLSFQPEAFNVKTEEYPLARRLFFYVPPAKRTPFVDQFVDFTLSSQAQPVVTNAGFIGLGIDTGSELYTLQRNQYSRLMGPTALDSSRPLVQGFSERIANSKRLSVTYRFRTGLSDLDNRAIEDIDRLAALLKATPELMQKITLFGFADARGNFQENLILSRNRAQNVANELVKRGVTLSPPQVLGYGIIAPVACNDSDQALEKNRRVEVWVRP